MQVRVDGGGWQEAELSAEVGVDYWRQWRLPVEVGVGEHRVQVRVIDRGGAVQTEARAAVAPNGSTGWHQVVFTCR
ncbi:hypothetical protein KEM60_01190 [Austwickia sp. TVS 96-490-7B]|nr:hypothetical protein [Austwickia sp. TVS 96-490-7B]